MIPFLGPTDPFPPVDQALDQPDGLLAAGGTLTMKRLVDAYKLGIFPWFNEGDPVLWWSPDPRTVLVPARMHISHSLKKRLKKNSFLITIDAAFGRVLDGCAAPRADDSGTWLTGQMRRAYTSLHVAGLAHSIEVWMDGELAGGIYGVALGRMFFGESMFSRRTDASKIAIARMAVQLDRWGFPLIDCQLETEHLMSLGAQHMPRSQFVAEVARLVNEPEPLWHLDEDLRGSVEHLPRILRDVRLEAGKTGHQAIRPSGHHAPRPKPHAPRPKTRYHQIVSDPKVRDRVSPEFEIKERVEHPKLWKVLLHNDDFTTQEFVVWVLETVFNMPPADAFAVMMHVHQAGVGVAGLFTRDVAETKVKATQRLAEQHEYPLLVTLEPDTQEARE